MKNANKDIADLAARLSGDAETPRLMEEAERQTRLIYSLARQRVHLGLTQKQLAAKIGMSTSAISRLEASCDADIKLGEFARYAEGVQMDLSYLLAGRDQPIAQRIKLLVCEVARDLDRLTELSQEAADDADTVAGIQRFRSEVLLNFLLKYQKTGEGVPPCPDRVERIPAKAAPSVKGTGTPSPRRRGAAPVR